MIFRLDLDLGIYVHSLWRREIILPPDTGFYHVEDFAEEDVPRQRMSASSVSSAVTHSAVYSAWCTSILHEDGHKNKSQPSAWTEIEIENSPRKERIY